MNGPLDSPRVTPRRQISACLALAAAALLMLGCGSSEEGGDVSFGENASRDFQAKLDLIQGFIDDQDCERATDAIGVLNDAVGISEETSEQAKSDLQELLGELDAQVNDQCESTDETTSSSTTSTKEDTTSSETTESTITETSTEETTTEDTTTEKPEEPSTPTPPETSPGGGNGPPGGVPPGQAGGTGGTGGESGGVGPGFESGRNLGG